jgi:tetratricopeptide (TPR) repeat protein/DNA-binding XRE family transcriptional regulator
LAGSGALAALLRELRADAGLTQEELAEAAQLSVRTISDLERGVYPTARKETARLLADALCLTDESRVEFEAVARGRQPGKQAGTRPGASGPGGAAAAIRTLPRDIGSFTGREAELAELVLAATAGGVVGIRAIGGMAGVGKTALAVHAAHRLADQFPDGQFFLPLHGHTPGRPPVEPSDALISLLLTAGVPAAGIPPDAEIRAALWRDRLMGKRAILVLDDATSSQQVRPLLPDSSTNLVLITSRRHLTALEDAQSISLDTLPADDAADLLIRLAARPDLTGPGLDALELARLCGYLPLAVGMVARQLHHHPAWTVGDLTTDLAAARDRLDVMATENLSVAAAFNLSYRDLSDAEQRMFRLLGLHPGTDTDVYAAAALADVDLRTARGLLEALYQQYLLAEPTRGRYRLHDLIREYTRSLTRDQDPLTDQDAAIRRLLDHYARAASVAAGLLAERPANDEISVVSAEGPAPAPELSSRDQAGRWLAAQRANVLGCVAFAAGPYPAHALRLVRAVSGQLMDDGHWVQAHRAHELALAAAKVSANQADLAWCLARLGRSHYLLDEYDAAVRSATQAVALYRELGDRQGLADAVVVLGDAQKLLDHDYARAVRALTEAIDIYREIGDLRGEARALAYLGGVYVEQSEYHTALRVLGRALGLSRELGDRRIQASALNYLSAAQCLTGDFPAAAVTVAEVIPIHRELGSKFGEAHALLNLGSIQSATGSYPAAIRAVTNALRIYRELGDRHGMGTSYIYLGEAYTATGRYAEAADLLDQALPIYRDIGGVYGEANVYRIRGEIARRRGDHTVAAPLLERALALYRKGGIRLGEADSLTALGDVRRRAGQLEAAAELVGQGLTIFLDIGDHRGQADAHNQLGALSLDTGEIAQARDHHTAALELAVEIGSHLEEADALAGLGRCLAAIGEPDPARARIGEALAIYRRLGSPRGEEAAALLTGI